MKTASVRHLCMATVLAVTCLGAIPAVSIHAGAAATYPSGVDMNRVVYVATGSPQRISLVDSDGSHATSFPVLTGPNDPTVFDPVLSPDGSRILFTADLFSVGAVSIDLVNSDGTGLSSLPTPAGIGYTYSPAWSPDGHRVAFRAFGTSSSGIWTENLDGSGAVRLSVSPSDGDPTWSPDGSEVAFESGGQISLAPSSGGPVHHFTNLPGARAERPHWSPNGQFIEFENPNATLTSTAIDIADVVTGAVSTLFTESGAGAPLSWAPDSSHFVTTSNALQTGPISIINLQGQVVGNTGTAGEGPSWITPQGLPRYGSSVVGLSPTTGANGYRMATSDGGILSFGQGLYYGSMGGTQLHRPVVALASTPDTKGYWEVASDGGIFAFGDATFHGSTGSIHLNQPVVGMASTPVGEGYWLVAGDGGIFSYSDATFHGSTGSIHLNQPVVGMATTPDGGGYWLVASDGGIFSYGDASFFGSKA